MFWKTTLTALVSILIWPFGAEAALLAKPLPGRGSVQVYRSPGGTPEKLPLLTHTGKIRNLLVLRQKGTWLGVRVHWRPVRKIFWTRARSFRLRPVRTKILIDRSQKKLSMWQGRKKLWSTRVVVGKSKTPTPLGRFALNDFYRAGGDLRPLVFQTTAHSRKVRSWQDGPARIALHGRHGDLRVPWGTARSNGCIRTPDWALWKIRTRAIIGMPILIRR